MPKKIKIVLHTAILCVLAVFYSGCDKNDLDPEKVRSDLSEGTWNVSYYSDGDGSSFVFSDYDFKFNSDGVLHVHGDGTNINGSWSVVEFEGDWILDLYVSHISPFDQLDNDWEILSAKSTRIETSNTDDGTRYLNFERN